MKDQTIYFPTFLDFRGRVYPAPNYLSYQSNDLARSLLLFSTVDNTYNKTYDETLDLILNKGNLYKKTKKEYNNIINNIDYVKLYTANVFGKNKLSRKGRIN